MPTYVALLRGVNVGGNLLKMQRLVALCEKLRFTSPRTYVQSGNVVFQTPQATSSCKAALEDVLANETRLPVTVIIRTAAELQKLVRDNPYLKERGIDPSKLHLTFLERTPAKEALYTLAAFRAGMDRAQPFGAHIYVHCPNGYGRTKLSNNALEKILSVRATTRNWNTVNKLCELAAS